MQQNGSSDDLPFRCEIVRSSELSVAPHRPGQMLESFRVPPVALAAGLAPGRKIYLVPHVAFGCMTCNMRNEVTSHLDQLALDGCSEKQSIGVQTSGSLYLRPPPRAAQRAR